MPSTIFSSGSGASHTSQYFRDNPEKAEKYRQRQYERANAKRAAVPDDEREELLAKEREAMNLSNRRIRTLAFYAARKSAGDVITGELIKTELQYAVETRGRFKGSFHALRRGELASWDEIMFEPLKPTEAEREIADIIKAYAYADDFEEPEVIPDCEDINYTEPGGAPVSLKITPWLVSRRGHLECVDGLDRKHFDEYYTRTMDEPKERWNAKRTPWKDARIGVDKMVKFVDAENAKKPGENHNCLIPIRIQTKDGKKIKRPLGTLVYDEDAQKLKHVHTFDTVSGKYHYTQEDFKRDLASGLLEKQYDEGKIDGFGILLHSIVCFDFDKPAAFGKFRKDFKEAVCDGQKELTPAGMHVYFSQRDDVWVRDNVNTESKIDVLALTSSGYYREKGDDGKPFGEWRKSSNDSRVEDSTKTRRLSVCWPTTGYDLFGYAFDRPLNPIPDCLVPDDVRETRDTEGVSTTTYRLVDKADRDFVEFVADKYKAKYREAGQITTPGHECVSYNFTRSRRGPCPHGEEHISNGFYVNVYKDGDAFFKCLAGECKDKKLYHIGNKKYMAECCVEEYAGEEYVVPEVENEFEYEFNPNKFVNMINSTTRSTLMLSNDYGKYLNPSVFDTFSKFYVKCDAPSGHTVYKLAYANDGVPKVPTKYDIKTLKDTFSSLKVPILGVNDEGEPCILKKQDFLKAWEAHSTVYDAFTMTPNKPFGPYVIKSGKSKSMVYNLWAGIYSKINYDALDDRDISTEDDDLDFMWDLIRAMCNDDDQIHKYFLNWLWLTMNGRKTGKVICLINSAGGIGKGVLLEFLRNAVFGPHVSCRETRDSILGCFNGSLQDRLFVMMDEIETLRHDEVQRLKSLVTESSITIHRKNETAITSDDNYLNFIITSNFPFHHEDRRFVKIQPSDRLQDTAKLIQFAETKKDSVWYDNISVKFWVRVREYVKNNPVHVNKVPKTNDPRGMMNASREMVAFDRVMCIKYQAAGVETKKVKKGEVAKVPEVSVDTAVKIYQGEIDREVAEEFAKTSPGEKFNHKTFNHLLTTTFKVVWKTEVKARAREMVGIMPSYKEYNNILMKKKWMSEETAALLNA